MKMIFARYKLGWAKAASTYIYLGRTHGEQQKELLRSIRSMMAFILQPHEDLAPILTNMSI